MTTATMTPVSEAAATSTPVKIRNRSSVLLIMLFAMLSMTCNYFAYRALFAKRRILRSLRGNGSSDDAGFQPGHQRAQMIEEEDILNDMIMKEMLEAATATATATTTDADADSISNPANRGYYYSQEETTASSSPTSFSSPKN